ncbi:interleukin-1 receptor-associated kinase 3-like isoform X2 [Petromyzon marinus]|uniref:interleukin-1 receptor-associated kinase 3-like isoform X2 n=1 Tax=Petromyzon marinus TaxID=7757 RepID=UPI003F71B837
MEPTWSRLHVHELPPAVFFGVARILDSCDSVSGARHFAAHVLDDQMKVREIENSRRGHSMAEEVLWLWAQKNATVHDLLQVLIAIENHRCVEYLQRELTGSPSAHPRHSLPGASLPPPDHHHSVPASPDFAREAVPPTPDGGVEMDEPGVLLLPPHPPSHSFCSLKCYKQHLLQPRDPIKCADHTSATPSPLSVAPQGNPKEKGTTINNLSQPPSSKVSASLQAEPESWLRFSHDMVCSGTQNFSEGRKIGEGSLGTVYGAFICQTDYAAKLLRQTGRFKEEGAWKVVESEARNLSQLKHPNIIVLAGYSQKDEQCCLIYELAANGSLSDRLQRAGGTAPLGWRRRLAIAVGLARAVLFLHSSQAAPVVHGNVRSSKVLLTEGFEPKLGGFGLASLRPSLGLARDHSVTVTMRTSLLGSQLAYLPDEFLKDGQLSTSLDVYSCGIVLLELLSGIKAYDASRKPRLLKDLVLDSDPSLPPEQLVDKTAGAWPSSVSSALLALALRCIGTRKSRPHIREVYEELEILHKGHFTDDLHVFAGSTFGGTFANAPQQHRPQRRRPAEMTDVHSAELPLAVPAAGPRSLKAGGAAVAKSDVASCKPVDARSLRHEDGTKKAYGGVSKADAFEVFPHEGTTSSLLLQSLEASFKADTDSWTFDLIEAKYGRAPAESLDPVMQLELEAARGEDKSDGRRSAEPFDRADAEAVSSRVPRADHGAGAASEALSGLSLSRAREDAAAAARRDALADVEPEVVGADSCTAPEERFPRERPPGGGADEGGPCEDSTKPAAAAGETSQEGPSNFEAGSVSEQAGACGSTGAYESQHISRAARSS